ncbi:hypothetical protein DH2020_026652 [Rehmannia glutinosa]|uniref:Protein FAR1-RELATED SEQUENCE n=1 Tax=Rehmannia glutinosa TaxID=99300 RepID=A0ABR0VZW6_REHGL
MDISNDDNERNEVGNEIVGGGDGVDFNAVNDNKSGINSYMPQNGMEFETKESAYSFYREYARLVGFGITIKASRRSKKSGKFIDIKIACSRFGSKRPSSTAISPRACPKTDCKASMHIKKYPEGKWFVFSFVEEHNHEICPDDFYNAVRGKKNQSTNVVCQKKGLQLALDERDVRFCWIVSCKCKLRLRVSTMDVGPNLSQKLTEFKVFVKKLKKCVYGSWTKEEFEKRWQKMVNKFDVTDNKWIQSLYEDRRKWIPTFMRNVFLGGFCTVERSQSVASYFDKYLQKDTTIEVFIDHYKLLLHERCEAEAKAQIKDQHAPPALISHSPFEKQMSKLYTHAIYKKFQAEVSGIVACTVGKEGEDERTIAYRVVDLERKQCFTVSWNKRKYDICCLCHLFEYSGFLCRHALSVLQLSGISTIPSNYILKRWTQKAKMRDTAHQASINTNFRIERLNDLCKLAIELGEEGSLSGKLIELHVML